MSRPLPILYGLMMLALLAVARRRWAFRFPAEMANGFPVPGDAGVMPRADTLALDSLADVLIDNDPFRLTNEPSDVSFDPNQDVAQHTAGTAAPPRVRPIMSLKAIVGGPPWQAILDGIPGQPPGAIVRPGDVFDRLSIVAVARESVIVRGPDTTWTLTFKAHP